jgi:hypothetical protein
MVYASVKRRAAAMKALCALMMVAGAMLLASADDDVRQQDVSPAQRLAPGMSGAYFTYSTNANRHDPSLRMKTLDSCFGRFNDAECEVNFRFRQHELLQLFNQLGFPASVRIGATASWGGMVFHKSELLLVMLRRLAYPCRLADLRPMFGLSSPQLSVVFEYAVGFLTQKYEGMLRSPCIWGDYIPGWADCIFDKIGRFDCVFAFIDGTVRHISRPGPRAVPGVVDRVDVQRLFYSGHKRKHAIKFQTMVAPCGLIIHLFGPHPGRGNDAGMFRTSGLAGALARLRALMQHVTDVNGNVISYYVYGDPAYRNSAYMMRSIFGLGMTIQDALVNTDMSKGRICVEWQYGELLQLFAFLDFSRGLQLFLSPIHHYFVAGVLLLNCRLCMRGIEGKTARYFNCTPPSLIEYLSMWNDRRL